MIKNDVNNKAAQPVLVGSLSLPVETMIAREVARESRVDLAVSQGNTIKKDIVSHMQHGG